MSRNPPPYAIYRPVRRPVRYSDYPEHIDDMTPSPSPTPERINRSRRVRSAQNPTGISTTTSWSTRKKVLLGLIIGAISIAVIVGIILAVVFTRPKDTATTTTTIGTYISVSWSFDNTTAEVYGVYNGQLLNSATYSPISSTVPYVGQGQALSLSATLSQSYIVTTPFLNLAYTSFTVEAWVFSSNYAGDNGVIGQCQCSSCPNQCFFFLIRGARLYVGFTLNDLTGLSALIANNWYHVAFVYNYATRQQIVYLNGVQDNIKSNADPYQGRIGNISIGSTQLLLTTNYFTGYIDNLKIVTRAKSAKEILDDATLIAYYSFDLPYPNMDNGPNGLNGSSINTAVVSGRVNQAMRFVGTSSYFQAYGFYQLGFGVFTNKPYSVSVWINIASAISCVFLQQSTTATGGSCFNMLGLFTYGGRNVQIVGQGYAWPAIFGPFITVNRWTHIAWTFNLNDGYTLYVDGVPFGTTGYFSYGGTSGVITWIQLGYNFGCSSQYITNTPYQGILDEMYFYSRDLTAAEVAALANP